jgi:hypothetical protein
MDDAMIAFQVHQATHSDATVWFSDYGEQFFADRRRQRLKNR